MEIRVLFLGTIFMEKTQQSANSCRVPQQHLQGFKTWNDFVSACKIPELSKNLMKQPRSAKYYLYSLVTMRGNTEQKATLY